MKPNIVKVSLEESRVLRWLLKAVSKDHARPRLNCIHVNSKKGVVEAIDGFRLHVVETGALPESDLKDGLQKVVCVGMYVENHDISMYGTLEPPDIARVVQRKEEPVTVAVNATFLRETISGMTGPVILRVFPNNAPIEIIGHIAGSRCYALIMPMLLEVKDKDLFLLYAKTSEPDQGKEE